MELPPGLVYLAQKLPAIFAPAAFVYLLNAVLTLIDVRISTWLLGVAYASSLPVTFAVKVIYKDFIDHRNARALRAWIPLLPPGASWSGIGPMLNAAKEVKDNYPGTTDCE